MVGLEEKVQPLKAKTSSLFLLVRSLTCRYAVISGLSSNSEFLHFKNLIKRFLNFFSSPIFIFKTLFFELTLSKILISIKFPSSDSEFSRELPFEI